MTRRHAHLAAVVAALAVFAGSAAPARSDDPAPPTQLLPDLRQRLPSAVQVAQIGAEWRLGFASEVANDGPGYLKIVGNGPGNESMVADQIVQMSDGSTMTVAAVGDMAYVRGNHNHFHLLDFERYEIRRADDPGNAIVRDQKTGFCLANAFTADICGRDQPTLTTVSEGISAGGSDKYLGYLEGQYLVLDPGTTPDGDYLLVNRVNPTGALLDLDPSDNAASLRVQLAWTNGTPVVTITNSCPAQIDCPAPPPKPDPEPNRPPPPGQAPPQQQPQDQQPPAEAAAPIPDPELVPVVPASEFGRPPAPAMSREMAGRLVRRAIQKSTKNVPRGLRTTCTRRARASFSCRSAWRGARDVRWAGRIRVWFRERSGVLSWFYDVSARPTGGKLLVKRSVRGSASSASCRARAASSYCARLP